MSNVQIMKTKQGSRLPASPSLKVVDGGISAVGGVGRPHANVPFNRPMPRQITATLDNSATATATTYMIFDPIGAVAAGLGGSYTAATLNGLGATVINKSVAAGRALGFMGFNYRVTTGSAAQFDQAFKIGTAGLDGSANTTPVLVSGSIRNTQNNEKLLTIEQEILVDEMTGIIVTVAANTAVSLDFFVQAQYGAF